MKSEIIQFDRFLDYQEIEEEISKFDKGCVIMIHKSENEQGTIIEIQYI